MTQQVHVGVPGGGYDIMVGERLLAKAQAHIAPLLKTPSTIIISDENVAKLYLHRLTNSLDTQGIRSRCVIIKSGESSKSLAGFSELIEQVLELKPDRHTTLIALGGGVVGDITGFAASVLLRGVDFIQIPTTLLAQVDSSVGGKTGINSSHGKNLIGSFHQPRFVLTDVSLLSTLPRRELMAGYAEMLKYGLINDLVFFEWLEKNALDFLSSPANAGKLVAAIIASCKNKAAIVEADEKEQGLRALLNFGHTFGHALEAETGFSDRLLHGEAVAIGMMLALQLSVKLGLCTVPHYQRVKAHYEAVNLLHDLRQVQENWNVDALVEHMRGDKKNKDGQMTFILSRGIGKAFIATNIEAAKIREFLHECLKDMD